MIKENHGDSLHPEVLDFLDIVFENAMRLDNISEAMIKLESLQSQLN